METGPETTPGSQSIIRCEVLKQELNCCAKCLHSRNHHLMVDLQSFWREMEVGMGSRKTSCCLQNLGDLLYPPQDFLYISFCSFPFKAIELVSYNC